MGTFHPRTKQSDEPQFAWPLLASCAALATKSASPSTLLCVCLCVCVTSLTLPCLNVFCSGLVWMIYLVPTATCAWQNAAIEGQQ